MDIKKDNNWFKRQWIKLKRNYSNSELFWNLILYIVTIIFLFINFQIVLGLSMIASMFLLLHTIFEEKEFKQLPLWLPLVLLFYVGAIVGALSFACLYIWENTIGKFNKWINNK